VFLPNFQGRKTLNWHQNEEKWDAGCQIMHELFGWHLIFTYLCPRLHIQTSISNSNHDTEKNAFISFDRALKHLLREKANHDVLEGFVSVMLGRTITIKTLLES